MIESSELFIPESAIHLQTDQEIIETILEIRTGLDMPKNNWYIFNIPNWQKTPDCNKGFEIFKYWLNEIEDFESDQCFKERILPELPINLQYSYRSTTMPFLWKQLTSKEIAYVLLEKISIRQTDPENTPWSIGTIDNWLTPDDVKWGSSLYRYYRIQTSGMDKFKNEILPHLPPCWQNNFRSLKKYHPRIKNTSPEALAKLINQLSTSESWTLCSLKSHNNELTGKLIYDILRRSHGNNTIHFFENHILPLLDKALIATYKPD